MRSQLQSWNNITTAAKRRTHALTQPPHELQTIAARFPDVSEELLERRALLRRTDSKYLVPTTELGAILAPLDGDYGAMKAGNVSLADYRTLYFDTPELRCFHDHRRGRRPRHKVRIRHYPDRQVSFLEVKTKRSTATTYKYRTEKSYGSRDLDDTERLFVETHTGLDVGRLAPQAWTNFRRLSLVGIHTNERVTIDLDLNLKTDDQETDLDGVSVIEVKQAPFCIRTPVMQRLKELGLRSVSSSKYVTAIALTHPEIRLSRLRPTLRILDRLL